VAVAEQLAEAMPSLAITIDPVENRGFEYHTGVSFSFFARSVKTELGRGGRYRTGIEAGAAGDATGFTLYTEAVLGAMTPHRPAPRLYVPAGGDAASASRWRAQGYVTVAGLVPAKDATAEARRLGCSHVLDGEKAITV
jgi:ATP phosphoribosyltransferase regulatory subunit